MQESLAFTAAQLAAALGVSPRRVRTMLRGVPRKGAAVVGGNTAEAWSIDGLPQRLLERLATSAKTRDTGSIHELLSAAAQRWQPLVPLDRIHPDAIARATRLRDALQEVVSRYAGHTAHPDLIRDGLNSYRRMVGHVVTARHLRRLLDRTIVRDRGFAEWSRWELYLEERPAIVAPAPSSGAPSLLRGAISGVADPAHVTAGELKIIWVSALEEIAALTNTGTARKTAVAAVIDVLMRAPGLCGKSRESIEAALRRRFNRLLRTGRAVDAVEDGRRTNSHVNGRLQLNSEDEKEILARALMRGGGLTQAWRELVQEHALSPELLARLGRRGRSKSYVPESIRDALQYKVDMLQPHRRGPRTAALAGAYVNVDPSNVGSGDWWEADDKTLDLYFYDEAEDGTIQVMRGQWILFIDWRSLMVLGFSLIPERNYSSFDIRNTITHVADAHGLPRRGFRFENGLWRRARLLKGRNLAPWQGAELGLRGLGLEFSHAKYPRGKRIEGVLGIIDHWILGDPGYVGSNESRDRFERTQRLLQDVRAGRRDAREVLWSKHQWEARLHEICERYNEEPNEGKNCAGLSPREAYEKFYTTPTVKLTQDTRYLLATHSMREKVTGNGIRIQIGRHVFRYKSEATGQFVGREVKCWFSVESPDMLSFESPDGTEIHTAEREISPPAFDTAHPDFSAALSQNAAQDRYARELYRALTPRFSAEFQDRRFRATIVDQASAARGATMANHQAEIRAQRKATHAGDAELQAVARRLGLSSVARERDPARARQQLEGLRVVEEFLSESNETDGNHER